MDKLNKAIPTQAARHPTCKRRRLFRFLCKFAGSLTGAPEKINNYKEVPQRVVVSPDTHRKAHPAGIFSSPQASNFASISNR